MKRLSPRGAESPRTLRHGSRLQIFGLGIDPTIIIFGFGIGVLVGMTGMGGASLMTPLLILIFGIKPVTAIGTDIFYAAVTKTVGGYKHLKLGTVHKGIAFWLAVGSVPVGDRRRLGDRVAPASATATTSTRSCSGCSAAPCSSSASRPCCARCSSPA